MKRKVSLGILLVLLFVAIAHRESPPAKPSAPVAAATEAAALPLSKQLARPLAFEPSDAPDDEACARQENAVAHLDLTPFGVSSPKYPGLFHLNAVDSLLDTLAPTTATACANPPASMVRFSHYCAMAREAGSRRREATLPDPDLPEDTTWRRSPIELCLRYLSRTRQDLADRALTGKLLAEVNDIPTLLHFFHARARKNPNDLHMLTAILRRLGHLAPENVDVAALAVQVAYAQWRDLVRREGAPVRSDELRENAERLQELLPKSAHYPAYRIDHDLATGDFGAVRELASQLATMPDTATIGHYGLARLAVAEGRIADAKQHLRSVLAADSTEDKVDAQVALDRLERGLVSSDAFPSPTVVLGTSFLVEHELVSDVTVSLVGGGALASRDPADEASVHKAIRIRRAGVMSGTGREREAPDEE